jgi:RNA polymerase sigma-70 factor, ECF subfamily
MSAANAGPAFSDADLISRVILDDDRHAFAELVRRHQSAMRASLRKLTRGDDGLADDLAQEAFILAYRNIRQFRFDAKFSTWLYRIAYNAFVSEMRKSREVLIDEDQQTLDSADPAPSMAEASNLKLDMERAMQGLSDAERAAIVQCYYNDLTHEEAAYVLGIPLGTVKTNVLKAKEKMKARMTACNTALAR